MRSENILVRWAVLARVPAVLLALNACTVAVGPPVFSSPSPGSAVALRGVVLNTSPETRRAQPTASPGHLAQPGPGAALEVSDRGATSETREASQAEPEDCTPEPSGKPAIDAFLGNSGICDDDVETSEGVPSGDSAEKAPSGVREAQPGGESSGEVGARVPPLAAQDDGVVEEAMREGLVFVQPQGVIRYWDIYTAVDTLMDGACPSRVDILCEPITATRREGAVWASAKDRTIHVRSVEPDACSLDGLEPQLVANLFKVCLGSLTERDGVALSRHVKGLRFLEEGFSQYLLTRDEVARFGGHPAASREFMTFVAQGELARGFTFDSFWNRLPTVDELADPAYVPHPRRFEAQFVAGAFLTYLVETEGLGVDGYLELWKRIAATPMSVGADGYAIPEGAVVPVLNTLLGDITSDRISDILTSWSRFADGVSRIEYHRPTVRMDQGRDKVTLVFSRPMRTDRADLMINGMQFGVERFDGRLAAWKNPRTVVIDLSAAREQFGIDDVRTIRVNGGRCWQWTLSEDGVPAEDTTFAVSAGE